MRRNVQAETDRAVWLVHVIQHTADELNMSVPDTVRLLDEYGLVAQILSGYRSLHTQGYEYMAELMTDLLQEAQVGV